MNDDWYSNPKNWAGWPPKMLSIALPMPRGAKPDVPTVTMKRSISIAHLQDDPSLGDEMRDAIHASVLKIVRRQEAQLLGLFMGETFPPDTEAEHLTVNESIEKALKSVRALMPKRITKVREAYLSTGTYAVLFWSDGSINHVTATADALLYHLAHVDHVLADALREEWGEYQMGLSRKVQEMQTEKGKRMSGTPLTEARLKELERDFRFSDYAKRENDITPDEALAYLQSKTQVFYNPELDFKRPYVVYIRESAWACDDQTLVYKATEVAHDALLEAVPGLIAEIRRLRGVEG